MKAVSEYPTARLGDLVTIYGGGTPLRSNLEYYSGMIPWVTPKDMKCWELHDSQEHITPLAIDESATKLIPTDSVLVVARSGVLKHTLPVALNRVPVTVNQDMKALVCGERIRADYLARYVKHASPVLLNAVRATTADNFPLDVLRDLAVPLPPVSEQARIAAILNRADMIRQKRHESVDLTTVLLESVFVDTFGDPLTNPKAWPVIKVGALLARKPQIGTITPASTDGKVPVVRVGEIGNGDLDLSACGRVTLATADLEKYQLAPGDVLLARAIGSKEHLGKASLFTRANETAVFDSHVMRLRFNAERILPLFFLHWLRSNGGRAQFLRRAGRTAVQFNVNAEQMADIDLPLPPLSAQLDFVQVLGGVERTVRNLRRSLSLADDIFNSLVQRAFSGELVSKLAKAAHPDL